MFSQQQAVTIAVFACPRRAERALQALLSSNIAPATISALARDHPADDEAAERFLALVVDGVLGRRIGLGVLARDKGGPIVVTGALATRLQAARYPLHDPLGGALAASGLPLTAIEGYRAAVCSGHQLLIVETSDRLDVQQTLAPHGAAEVRTYAPAPTATLPPPVPTHATVAATRGRP